MWRSCFDGTEKLTGVVPFTSSLTVTLAPIGSDTTAILSVVPLSIVAQLEEKRSDAERAYAAKLLIDPLYRCIEFLPFRLTLRATMTCDRLCCRFRVRQHI